MRTVWGLTVVSLLSVTIGCGESGPEIASVEGVVKMDGKPLPNATVVFSPENGRPAGALTDENGYYILNFSGGRKGAIPGKNTVQIRTGMEGGIGDDGERSEGSAETVPAKYNVYSELVFTVEDGKANEANFDLTSDGELPTEGDADDN